MSLSRLAVAFKLLRSVYVHDHSLQAMWIRNSILHALRKSGYAESRSIPHSFVYQHSSITRLATFVQSLVQGSAAIKRSDKDALQAVNALVEKYTADLRTYESSSPEVVPSKGDVVLLTGTTGALGSNILASLAGLDEVRLVYAFNRKSKNGVSLKERQVAAFNDRGLDPAVLDGGKVMLVESDLTQADLGLTNDLLQEVCRCLFVNRFGRGR